MARDFSTEDVKELINRYSSIVRDLEDLVARFYVLGKRVADEADSVMKSKVIASLIEDQVKTGDFNMMPQPAEKALIQAALDYSHISSLADRIAWLYQEYGKQDSQRIDHLADAASPIKWLFSNKNSRQAMSDDYFELLRREEVYTKSITEAGTILNETGKISADVAYAQIPSQRDEIQSAIRYCYPDYDNGLGVPAYANSIQRYKDAVNLYESLKDTRDQRLKTLKDQVFKKARIAVAKQANQALQDYDVETLAQVRSGIRVKALRDSGYENVAKVYGAPLYAISSIYGISMESASIIKEAAEEIAIKVQNTTKLQISSDDRTPQISDLLSSLYYYGRFQILCGTNETRIDEIIKENPKLPSAILSVPNNIQWIFLEKEAKQQIHSTYVFAQRLNASGFEEAVREYQRAMNQPIVSRLEEVWNDFEKDPFPYFNLLEELVPGILGNNDNRYGLPEDLAREIQDQAYFPNGLKVSLRRYQEWGVKYILHQGRALLGDEMGLGKTVQAIATMVSLRNTGATRFMVVCPASVLPNWYKEIRTKSLLTAINIYGAYRAYALQEWMQKGGVAVTTYETIKNIQLQKGFQFDMLVVDEAHFIKNESAARSQNVRRISMYAKRLLFMTGTALENKVDEMLSLINILQPAVASNARSIAFMSQAPQFRKCIAPVYYRRKREDVLTELPAITEIKEWCDLLPQERDLYRSAVLSKNRTQIRRVSWNVQNLEQSSKARRLKELVEEATEDGRKILVFSFYLETIQRVMEVLGSRCTEPINGSVSVEHRQEIIDRFEQMPPGSVLPAQIMAGGTGLNIQAASVVIICEPQLKPSIENQAIARAYRMGQTRKVLVYRLLADDTIDERIDNMLSEKQAIFNAFADVSAAAAATQKEEQQIDDKTFGKLIQEEIDRINKETGNSSPTPNADAARMDARKSDMPASTQPTVSQKNIGNTTSVSGSSNQESRSEHSSDPMKNAASGKSVVVEVDKVPDISPASKPAYITPDRPRPVPRPVDISTSPYDNGSAAANSKRNDAKSRNINEQLPGQIDMFSSQSDHKEPEIKGMGKNEPAADNDDTANVMHRFKSFEDLLLLIRSLNVDYKDNRPKGGSLWIQANPVVDLILKEAIVLNADEIEIRPKYAAQCKAFNGQPGWYI